MSRKDSKDIVGFNSAGPILDSLKNDIFNSEIILDDRGRLGDDNIVSMKIKSAKNNLIEIGESERSAYRMIGSILIKYKDLYELDKDGESFLFKFITKALEGDDTSLEAAALIINIAHESAKNFAHFSKVLRHILPEEKYHLVSEQGSKFLELLKSSSSPFVKNAYMAAIQLAVTNGRTPLHEAIMDINMKSLRKLIKYGADLDVQDDFGRTPSHYAVFYRFPLALLALIEAKASQEIADHEGAGPMDIAIAQDDINVTLMCANNSKLSTASLQNLLHLASYYGNSDQVAKILDSGVAANTIDRDSNTPLIYAAMEGNTEVASVLLIAGADPNAKGAFGRAPLHYSAIKGDRDFVKLLLVGDGVKVNEVDSFGKTPLDHAVSHINVNTVFELIKSGGKASVKSGEFIRKRLTQSPGMMDASTKEIIDRDKLLLDTVLAGDEKGIVYLAMAGANFDIADERGKSAFSHCLSGNLTGAAFMLMQYEAIDVDKEIASVSGDGSDQGISEALNEILLKAVFYKKEKILVKLLDLGGADVFAKDKEGNSPLSHAIEHSSHNAIIVLVQGMYKKSGRDDGDFAINLQNSLSPKHYKEVTNDEFLQNLKKSTDFAQINVGNILSRAKREVEKVKDGAPSASPSSAAAGPAAASGSRSSSSEGDNGGLYF